MNIIYIDDNFINRYLLKENLESTHNIVCVGKASELYELFSKNSYDLVLIDLNLNDTSIDGFGIISYLKSNFPKSKSKFAAHTTYAGEEWEAKCKTAGFDFFWPKPFDEKLLDQINTL